MTVNNSTPGVFKSCERALIDLMPERLASALIEFVQEKMTGQITLNFKDGKVQAIDIRETVRVSS